MSPISAMRAQRQLLLLLLTVASGASAWRTCSIDEPEFGAVHGGDATLALRSALLACDETVVPLNGTFVSGPLNLTSNKVLNVQGIILASTDPADYPLVQPMVGYGWGDDQNCFAPDRHAHKIIPGSYRYSPVVGAYNASNITVTGSGTIDGRGQTWWSNCTACAYPPHNDSRFCEIASRPKLMVLLLLVLLLIVLLLLLVQLLLLVLLVLTLLSLASSGL